MWTWDLHSVGLILDMASGWCVFGVVANAGIHCFAVLGGVTVLTNDTGHLHTLASLLSHSTCESAPFAFLFGGSSA